MRPGHALAQITRRGGRHLLRHQRWVLALLTILSLLPFLGKAYHIDEPVYVWVAQRIHRAPLDPYGFTFNWLGHEAAVATSINRPPLVMYWLALGAWVCGSWHEAVLRAWMLPVAVALVLGAHALARQLGARPLWAALAMLCAPAYLVSSASVMVDMPMVACWVWALTFWVRGLRRDERPALAAGAAAAAAAVMCHLAAMNLLLLMLVYGFLRRRRPGLWLLWLLAPAAALAGYQWLTHELYGQGLLTATIRYAQARQQPTQFAERIGRLLIALSFLGGCVGGPVLLSLLHWCRRALLAGTVLALTAAAVLLQRDTLGPLALGSAGSINWLALTQLLLFISAGSFLIGGALVHLTRRRSAEAALLVLWLLGVFIFSGWLNWTINARSLLPLVPAAAVLLAQRRGAGRARLPRSAPVGAALILAAGWGLALSVVAADAAHGNAGRRAANTFAQRFLAPDRTLWFQGHWSFQYYLQRAGGKPLDFHAHHLLPGDLVVIPFNNTNTRLYPPPDAARLVEMIDHGVLTGPATMDRAVGAGLHADVWGPMAFAWGQARRQHYLILRVDKPVMVGKVDAADNSP